MIVIQKLIEFPLISRLVRCRGNLLKERRNYNIPNKHIPCQLRVLTLPALEDNYMYVLIDQVTKIAAAIDPVESEKVLNAVKTEGVTLTTVLTTHHHFDHSGGNKLICERVKNLTVFGGDNRIDNLTSKISHGYTFKLGELLVKCLETPCHTSGHVCYYVQASESDPVCFTGDTLFVGGCGRFFEGGPEQMHSSLSILSALPGNTKIYCGHEYTLSNLKFAVSIEPDNDSAKKKLAWVIAKCKNFEATVPSTIKDELSFNPFLRVTEKSLKCFTQKSNPVDVMKALREAKDNFKG